MKPATDQGMTTDADAAVPRREEAGGPPAERAPRVSLRWPAVAVAVLAVAVAAGAIGYDRYREARLADSVRRAFAARRYEEVRGPLGRWLDRRPRSGEAHYYRAMLALVDDRPQEVAEGVGRAMALGFDRAALDVLQGLFQARAGHINEAEPILRRAYDQDREPRAEVARSLARIYLATYRLPQAAEVVERYRELMPSDPQSYLWSNEIASRTGAQPAVLIRNYRAAQERDPALDKARLGLAEQLGKVGRYEEAEVEYRTYLRRNPKQASALVGLGRNALQNGDIDEAVREFEAAVAVDPRRVDALRELAQLDMRYGRLEQARRRLELLTQLEPFDHEVRYSYAQSLNFLGESEKARIEGERAAELRKDQDRILRLQARILGDSNDLGSRLEVARWMLEHGHVEEGLKWTREILRADPGHAATHRALAEYYARHGNPGLANYHRTMASGGRDSP